MKRMILASFCMYLSAMAGAQVRYGIKAGLNFNQPISGQKGNGTQSNWPGFFNVPGGTVIPVNTANAHGIDRFKLHTDFHAGITADIPLAKNIHLRPDLLYSRRVADYKSRTSNTYIKEKFSADYLELPVHVVYYHQMKNAAVYIGGGPYVALGLSGKANGSWYYSASEFDLQQYSSFSTAKQDDWYEKTQFGAVIAAGVDLPFGLTGELSVHRGFNDINKSHIDNYNKVINFNYALSVGYLIGKKKS